MAAVGQLWYRAGGHGRVVGGSAPSFARRLQRLVRAGDHVYARGKVRSDRPGLVWGWQRHGADQPATFARGAAF